ncbi:elongation factor G [Noviherbaspirillum galbum]|uniref:Elongation factor G n=1 Tax=Noviherbaspirillum galbum TaxID=2709383 RepID=A0A6B3SV53_9BURK|nr:elongation factor G [Noviherbaspirillum galbum]NEX62252.1 elongation factor G [Noviherbaspirillum galbum]
MPYSTHDLRNVALVGHSGCGKTSLVEALLHAAGMQGTPGSVDRGNTVSDHDPLERKYRHSLSSSVIHLEHRDSHVNLIDTPGYPDFIGHAISALPAAETAAVVIDAQAGIEMVTLRMMELARARGMCRLIIVNKIDLPDVDLPGLVLRIQEAFGKECLPINLPAGHGQAVEDCFFHADGDADFSTVAAAHRALMDQVVEVDAAFMETYLDQGDIDPEVLHAPFEQALREGHLIPVCFVSAQNGAGLPQLLELLVRLMPDPTEGNPQQFYQDAVGNDGDDGTAGRKLLHASPDPSLHVLAHVFKIAVDPYVGKMAIFRVHQGTVRRDSTLYIGDNRKPFRVAHLYRLLGKEQIETPQAVPGDICAVTRIDEIGYDAILHDAVEDARIHLEPSPLPQPIYGLSIAPRKHGDEQRLWDLLQKLCAEDPCLRVDRMGSTGETVLSGLGELHLRSVLDRMTEVYKTEVITHPPKIAYRETIAAMADGHHRHKKQSGGAGQFGEVFLRIEPLPRGAGFEFVDAVKGGVIPRQFLPAVEKGVRQAMESGPVSGHLMQDVRVTVYDGKSHPVDSKEVAFVVAARKAFRDAASKARPILLEPVVAFEVSLPEDSTGDVTADLSGRRGQISGMRRGHGSVAIISGHVPLSELNGYQSRLNAMTAARGSYTISFSHYDAVPPLMQQRMASQHKAVEDDA